MCITLFNEPSASRVSMDAMKGGAFVRRRSQSILMAIMFYVMAFVAINMLMYMAYSNKGYLCP